jgi:hypothetical protein
MPAKTKKTHQQKKRERNVDDGRNLCGENDKSSRKNIRRIQAHP